MAKVSVMGAGSWGLGLAILLNNNGHDVKVWSVFPEEIKVLDKERENKKCLPGVHIPEKIEMTADTEYAVNGADVIVLAVASPYTRSTAKLFAPFVKEGQYVVNVGKGIEESTLMTLCQVVDGRNSGGNGCCAFRTKPRRRSGTSDSDDLCHWYT